MKKFFLLALLATVLAGTASAQLPNLKLKDINGKEVRTDTLNNGGKPFIITFFATWCKPCNRELKAIQEVYEEWQEETGVRVVAISIDQAQNIHKVKPLVDGYGWEYEILLDPNSEFKRAMGVNMIPHAFVIDGNGKVALSHSGYKEGGEEELYEKVKELLAQDGFEDNDYIETEKHTFTAPFVNAEEVQYLVIEDNYTNGRPPLNLGGALYTTRETVDKVETMKVTTCLNPLHTAMSIYGCMLGYTLISAEMADEDLRPFIQKIGYMEAMPVVVDPGVLNPYEFIGAVINRRLPNPFMPDAPQRIAMDTSQKLPIRFGETIKKYIIRGLDMSNLILIPLTLAGYARYLKGIKDDGTPFEPSPDPMLAEMQAIVAPLEIGKADQDWSCLKQLYSRKDVFGLDLYEAGLGEQIEGMVKELYAGNGAVRATLHKYVSAR